MDITISRLKEIIKEEIQTHKNEGMKYKREDDVNEEAEELEEGAACEGDATNEEVEDLEEIAAKRRGNEDRDQGRNRMLPDRLHEDEAEETPHAKAEREFLDANPGLKVDVSKGIEKLKRSRSKTQKESLGLEEAIASQVDNLLIEMGMMEAPQPTTLEEHIASVVDQYIPLGAQQDNLNEVTDTSDSEPQKSENSNPIDIRSTIEEAVKKFVKENTVEMTEQTEDEIEMPDLPKPDLPTDAEEEARVELEEAEIKTSIKEWYNSEKFEALKKKWAK